MGDALWTPPAEDLRRQLTAGALAIAINAALIAGLLFIPRDLPAPADTSVVSVVLVPRPAPAADPGTGIGNARRRHGDHDGRRHAYL